MKVKVYSLESPITGQIRYVGITKQSLNQRLISHICSAKKLNRTHLHRWINSLPDRPIIKLLDEVEDDWPYWERYWIQQLRQWGFRLANHSLGGEGAFGVKHSEEFCKNMSIRNKLMGIKPPSNLGITHSQETKDKMSKAHKGKILTPEHKIKLSEAKKGKKLPHFEKAIIASNGKEYQSVTEAAADIGSSTGNICRALKHNRTAKNLTFKYKI